MAALTLAWAAPSAAQVIEVRDDGSVITYSGPLSYSDAGGRPLVSAALPTVPVARAPPPEVSKAIQASSTRHGVSASLVQAVAWQESRFRQSAVSPKGARGVMQLMPGTARSLGADASDLDANIDAGAAYLARMMRLFDGDLPRALAAYNAGPGAVMRFGGVPPYAETRNYVNSILASLTSASPAVLGLIP